MKTRATVLTATLLCAILFVLDVFIYFTLHARLMNIEETAVLSKAQSIAQSFANRAATRPLLPKPGQTPIKHRNDLAWMRAYNQFGEQIVLMTPQGQVLAATNRATANQLVSEFSSLHDPAQQTVRQLPNSSLFVSMPVQNANNQTISYVLLLSDISQVNEYMQNLLALLIGGSVGAVLLAAIGGYVVAAFAVRPLNQMIRTVRRIHLGRLNERVIEPHGHDEVARLALTFNEMLMRMERSFVQQSRFVTDASHEILTPLTTIQGYANLLDRWGKDNPEVLEKGIRVIQKESSRLQELAEDLLTLAALESSTKELDKRADVSALIEEVVDSMAVFRDDVRVTQSVEGGMQVAMAPAHLRQVMTNLVENAVKYQNAPGTVHIHAGRARGQVIIQVVDHGRGIPPADIPHIFDRFYRVDKSRGRREGGTGLGLSIVRELVDTYGGDIRVESELGRGTTFTLSLPVARRQRD